ncbi:sigma-70 family RNA polymerase sigma factor [Pilimelia columellifera subsp. columellifera]|uniref:RNA polymerase sigma factor n=2 Tax=Pilimelia TaxID=53370 RepID=A0ABP6AUW5_9ACTN
MPVDDDVTRWALAAANGDPVAQAAFVRATQTEVWRFTAALVDRSAADDLTQDTYLRAFRSLPAFEARSSARTWLLSIARHACADHVRALARSRRLADRLTAEAAVGADGPDPSGHLSAADLLGRLTEERRSAFALTQVLGLSYAEAAEIEEVAVGTIRSRVARARSDLITAHAQAMTG